MLFIALAMLVILLLAGGVLAYVTWPHRGEPMPVVPQVGAALGKAVDALPTLAQPSDAYQTTTARRA